jgi:syntaxin 16
LSGVAVRSRRCAELKGQTIEEYRPDLSLNDGASSKSGGAGFFDDDGPSDSCTDPRFSAAQTLQLVMAERMTEEREKAITQVAESVGELAEIFKEIQVLVIDQGTILDRIDYNIEQAADRVTNAVTELNKANEYQKKSRTMLCIYLLLVLCAFMVIVLVLKKTALGA